MNITDIVGKILYDFIDDNITKDYLIYKGISYNGDNGGTLSYYIYDRRIPRNELHNVIEFSSLAKFSIWNNAINIQADNFNSPIYKGIRLDDPLLFDSLKDVISTIIETCDLEAVRRGILQIKTYGEASRLAGI